MEGWIKLHRKMTVWEWYKNPNTFKLFIHCLLIANHEDKQWRGITIKRGQFVRTYANLATESGLTIQQVRTALSNMKSTQDITQSKVGRNLLFTIVSYEKYQDANTIPNTNSTSNQHETQHENNTKSNTKQEYKNTKKKENINSASASTESDLNALFEDVWKLYPNKKGKGQVSKAAKERLLKVGYEELARAIDRYKSELEKDSDWRKPQNGSTFFNSGYVDYLDANYEPLDSTTISKNQFNNYSGSNDKNVVNEFEKIFEMETERNK